MADLGVADLGVAPLGLAAEDVAPLGVMAFLHTFPVILSSVTRTLNNSNLPPTRSYFCLPSDHFYINLPSIT